MAVRTITTSIALDGEQKFKQQIGEVNRELRNLKTEMAYTEETFKGQANTTEALTAKSDLLKREVEQQTEKVRALEQAVRESAEAYGDTDAKTDNWRAQLNRAKTDLVKMERELKDTDRYLREAEGSFDGCAKSIDEFGKEADGNASMLDKLVDKIGGLKGAIAGGIAAKLTIDGAKEVMDAILEVEESTREYRQIMGTLEVSSQQAGYSADETAEAYRRLYGVLGDPQTTATTLANLQAVGVKQDELLLLIEQTVGAWGRYGDSIPVDGLAEAINETIRAGQVTGNLADVLNWGSKEGETFGVTLKENIEFTELSKKELEKLTEAQREEYEARKEQYESIQDYNEGVQEATVAEDMFNIALGNCETQAERTDLVLRTLSEMGLAEAGKSWRDVNEDIVAANESQQRMEDAMGRLGEAVAPAANAIRNVGATAIEFLADTIEGAIGLIQDFLELWDKFNSIEHQKAVEDRRTAARTGQSVPTSTAETATVAALQSAQLSTAGAQDEKFGRSNTVTEENINITVVSELDGEKVARNTTKYQRQYERAMQR